MCLFRAVAKVDHLGNFLPFPNITVVHNLQLNGRLKSLPQKLLQVAGTYISPLPPSSYHATLLCGPVFDFRPFSKKILYESCWRTMAMFLNDTSYCPELVVHSVLCFPAGEVVVKLGPAKKGREESNSQIIKDKLRDICTQEAIPMMDEYDRTWHITLAYGRQATLPIPPTVQKQICEVVQDAFQVLPDMNDDDPMVLSLESAQLCLSPDMKRFVPWDGMPP
ncbi:unnamed protein product [Cylindrotheca closterium]|uniref:DUF1868 domain-containing protein n=1 Tax=Cylindrotheca closterium TaxID=2856 RepID=A0AAD2G0P4_9STRA|nr:unnamed protein product [Cylindrotheca closterium]